MLAELLELIKTDAAPVLLGLVGGPESMFGGFVSSYPVISIILCIAIPALLLLLVALFFDFVQDSWKMPFGIACDVLAFYAFLDPGWLTAVAMIASVAAILILLHDVGALKYVFAAVSVGEIALTIVPSVPMWASAIAGILCLNTILFFVGCIID